MRAHHAAPITADITIHFHHFKRYCLHGSVPGVAMYRQLMLLKVRPSHAKIKKINFSPQRRNCYAQLSYDTGTTPYKKVHHTPYCCRVDTVYLFFREIKTRKCIYERVRHREAWKSSFHLLQIKYLRSNLGKSHCTDHGGDDSRSCLPAHLKSSRSMEIIILMNPECFGLTFLRVSELMQMDFTKGCRCV